MLRYRLSLLHFYFAWYPSYKIPFLQPLDRPLTAKRKRESFCWLGAWRAAMISAPPPCFRCVSFWGRARLRRVMFSCKEPTVYDAKLRVGERERSNNRLHAGARELLWSWGREQTSPGVQGNPYPKLKTHRIWPTIFWETQVHVQKQTKIKMNDFHSPKLGRWRPHSFKVVGASCPHCPPPRFPHPWLHAAFGADSSTVYI